MIHSFSLIHSPSLHYSSTRDANREKQSISNNITTEHNPDTFKIADFKLKNKCTYFEYGDIAIKQESYCCEVCDPNKTEMICYDCYTTCHRFCTKDDETNAEDQKEEQLQQITNLSSKQLSYFICECGKKKHEIERKNDKELDKRCLFTDFDYNMNRKYRTFCKTCNVPLCYICYITCHKKRNGCLCEKKIIKNYNSINNNINQLNDNNNHNNIECGCTNYKHSNMLAMTQIISKIIDKEEYEDVKNIWRLQLFNNFCLGRMSSDLFDETSYLIKDFKNDNNFRKNMFNICDRFVRLGKTIFKSQKYFYFKDTYVIKYPYMKLIETILQFKPGQFEKYGNFICSVCFFYYFLHLKKDFQNIKGLCIVDYFISSPLDRILYKRLINSNTIYTKELYEKYFISDEGKYCLDNICIELLELLDKAIIDFSVKRLDKCLKNYFTIFKIVYFCLKRFVFSIETLEKFVDVFLRLITCIYHFVNHRIQTKSNENQKEFKLFFTTLMNYITKINCAIVFGYNDLVFEEILFKKQQQIKEHNFIHFNSEFSKKVIRIIIISSLVYGSFNLNINNDNNDIDKEYLCFLNNLLEVLIKTNNIYFRRLNEINFETFVCFYKRYLKINDLENQINLIKQVQSPEIDDNYIASYIEDNNLKGINKIRKTVYNLKQELEMKFTMYFHYKLNIFDLQEQICLLLKNFCETESFTDLKKSVAIQDDNNSKTKQQYSLEYNQIIRNKKLTKYHTKIHNELSIYFPFTKKKYFNNVFISLLTDEFILSSFDTTITKIFFIDKSKKNLQENVIELILNFLLIYCITKDGMKNFCLGRNFRRVIKAFDLFPEKTLRFYYFIFKGIYLYNIDIKEHKKLPKIIKDLTNYIKNFHIKHVDEINIFKTYFVYVEKILFYTNSFLELEELSIIQQEMFEAIEKVGVFKLRNFGEMVPLYFIYEKKESNDSALKYIEDKFTFKTKEEIEIEDLHKKEKLRELNLSSDNSNLNKNDNHNDNESRIGDSNCELFDKQKYENEIHNEQNRKVIKNQLQHYKSDLLSKYYISLAHSSKKNTNNNNLQEGNINNNINPFSKLSPSKTLDINEKFFFSYLHLLSNTTFYQTLSLTYLNITSLFDIYFFKFILSKRYLKLKHRTTLIHFLYNFYLCDHIHPQTYIINSNKFPSSEEYVQFSNSTSNNPNQNYKLKQLTYLKTFIEIIIYELNHMKLILNDENERVVNGFNYISLLLTIIQMIGTLFISHDISSHVTLWFYEMVKEFLDNSMFIGNFLHKIKNKFSLDDIDFTKVEIIKTNTNQKDYFELEKKTYDIYNKNDLYLKLFTRLSKLFYETDYNSDNNLYKFLSYYQNANDMDFKIFSLNPIQDDFSALINYDKTHLIKQNQMNLQRGTVNINNIIISKKPSKMFSQEKGYDALFIKFRETKEEYIKQFVNLSQLSLIDILFTKSSDISIEFKDLFFDYIITSFYRINDISLCNITALFIIINKILFYDFEKAQNSINFIISKNEIINKHFSSQLFENNKIFLHKIINLQIILSKNPTWLSRYQNISILSKNMIQFFQLLGEGHNKVFQKLLVNGFQYIESNYKPLLLTSNCTDTSLSIFNVLCQNLTNILILLNLFTYDEITDEMPYDKLLVLVVSIINCLVEFFQGSNKKGFIDMHSQVNMCFDSMRKIVLMKLPPNPKRRKYMIILKINLLELISALIEEGYADLIEINALKEIMIMFQPIKLFDEVVKCFDYLVEEFKDKMKGVTFEDENVVNVLIELYKFDTDFQLSIELKLGFKIFYILKIIEEVYNRVEVVEYFKNIEQQYYDFVNGNNLENIEKEDNSDIEENDFHIKQQNQFDEQILESNEVNINSNNSLVKDSNDTIFPKNSRKQEGNKQIQRKNQIGHKNSSFSMQSKSTNGKFKSNISLPPNEFSYVKKKYFIYKFLTKIMRRIEIRNSNSSTLTPSHTTTSPSRDFSFFVLPPICLLLSNSTKTSFNENVDRETVATKIITLIEETDYFIFEMFYNKQRMANFSKLSTFLFNLNTIYFQYINYIFFVVENILIIYHNYDIKPIPDQNKRNLYIDGIIIQCIHLVFITFVLLIWFIYKFELQYKHKIMQNYKSTKFIFNKDDTRNEHLTENDSSLLHKIGADLTMSQKIRLIIINTILSNGEVNIFVFSFLLGILYLIIGNAIFIAIPLLFVANLNNILYGIVVSLQLRFKQLIIVLIFMYIIVYLFSWFAFYFFPELFEFIDLYNVKSDDTQTEKMCSSMVQCFLTMMNYGVRNGGGIGDVIPKISFNVDPGYFVAGFIFVVLNHILVVCIMLNLFFGIIVDTFAALREKTYRVEEDKTNICYICQMSRSSALNKNINFDLHINTIHCMWNYVSFMTYLHINNYKNFKSLETFVWEKIPKSDTSWLPIGESLDNE